MCAGVTANVIRVRKLDTAGSRPALMENVCLCVHVRVCELASEPMYCPTKRANAFFCLPALITAQRFEAFSCSKACLDSLRRDVECILHNSEQVFCTVRARRSPRLFVHKPAEYDGAELWFSTDRTCLLNVDPSRKNF